MLIVTLAAVALFADATPTASQAVVQPAPAAAKPAEKADNDIFCRKEAVLGTNIPKKVCYSKAEYEANRKESRETLEKIQAAIPARSGN